MSHHNHLNHRNHLNHSSGFTLAELLIATVILIFLIGTATAISTNFFSSLRNIQAANVVYDEANFTMERIIKEIRSGTVDYEEYYNQTENFQGIASNETYGQNYCQYSRQFYSAGPDGQFGTFDDESTGERRSVKAPIAEPIQKKLYLINASGDQRTYFQHVIYQEKDLSDPNNPKPIGKPIGKVGMLKLVGKDYGIDHLDSRVAVSSPCPRDSGEGDGLIDTWVCDAGFKCAEKSVSITLPNRTCGGTLKYPMDAPEHLDDVDPTIDVNNSEKSSFVDITPKTIDVVSLNFIITPQDDPRKAYNVPADQIQPNVTVKMVVRAAPQIASTFKGQTPSITLESTISTRATKEVITECNLQECIDGMEKPCPKHTGILTGAIQTCSQGVWPGCVETCTDPEAKNCYESVALKYVKTNVASLGILGANGMTPLTTDEQNATKADGKDHIFPFNSVPRTPFDSSPRTFYETTGGEMGSCGTDNACKVRRCSDGVDNDTNDKVDKNDPACLSYICNNGFKDFGEECIDVGGICQFIHPQLPANEGERTFATCTDKYDNDCSYIFDLTWGRLTPAQLAKIAATGLSLNANSTTAQINIALGLGADEYDQNCINQYFCVNGLKDPTLNNFGPKFYETPNYLFKKTPSTELNEICVDIGGLCDRTTDGKHKKKANEIEIKVNGVVTPETRDICSDGLDNDCDYNPATPGTGADEFDSECKAAICGNGRRDCDLADQTIVGSYPNLSYGYIFGYSDLLCTSTSDAVVSVNDEKCIDVGGICGTAGGPGEIKDETFDAIPTVSCFPPGNPQSSPICGCFDGKDNDCSNGTDGTIDNANYFFSFDTNAPATSKKADSKCCPNGDGDNFAAYSLYTCHPAEGNGQPGLIDCNDNDANIHPYAGMDRPDNPGRKNYSEVCDDAEYPTNYSVLALRGKPMDNNCSAVNKLYGAASDSGYDRDDPDCCIDSDLDGFGVQNANLYKRGPNGECAASFVDTSGERTPYDCEGLAPVGPNNTPAKDVNPGVKEGDILDNLNDPTYRAAMRAICSDRVNNSCRYVKVGAMLDMNKPRMDHLDMYANDPGGIAQAKIDLKFNPDCCHVTENPLYPNKEICDDGNSLLGSGNSDEDCSGLEGYSDNFCVVKTGPNEFNGFNDSLATNIYLDTNPAVPADYTAFYSSALGLVTMLPTNPLSDPASQSISSRPLQAANGCGIKKVTLNPVVTVPAGTSINFWVTNNGGADWTPIPPNAETPIATTTTDSSLKWKAELSKTSEEMPTITSIKLTWTCN